MSSFTPVNPPPRNSREPDPGPDELVSNGLIFDEARNDAGQEEALQAAREAQRLPEDEIDNEEEDTFIQEAPPARRVLGLNDDDVEEQSEDEAWDPSVAAPEDKFYL
ncbi:hypothetical protein FSARC_14013, partial [Fusarium sarcochroum]